MDRGYEEGLTGGLSDEDLGLVPNPEPDDPPPAKVPAWVIPVWLGGGSALIFLLRMAWQWLRGDPVEVMPLVFAIIFGWPVVGLAYLHETRGARPQLFGSLPAWVQAAVSFVMFATTWSVVGVTNGGLDADALALAFCVAAGATGLLTIRHSLWFVAGTSLAGGFFGMYARPVLSLFLMNDMGLVETFMLGALVGPVVGIPIWFGLKRVPDGGPSMIVMALLFNMPMIPWVLFNGFRP